MANDFKRDLEKFKLQIITSIKQFNDPIILSRFGEKAVDIIYKRTKSGKGLTSYSDGAALTKLEALSTGYIEYRKALVSGEVADTKTSVGQSLRSLTKSGKKKVKAEKKKAALGQFGDYFSPSRSNLTLSGQMLDALTYKISRGKITIFVKNSTRDDKFISFSNASGFGFDSKPLTNAEVSNKVQEYGRPFLGLAEIEKTIMIKFIEKDLRKFIRLIFK